MQPSKFCKLDASARMTLQGNPAISCGMPADKPSRDKPSAAPSEPEQRPPQHVVDEMFAIVDKRGLKQRDIAKLAGIDESGVSRLRKGTGTINNARKMRNAIIAKLGEPVQPMTLDDDAEEDTDWVAKWVELGRRLYALDADHKQYENAVRQVRFFLHSAEIAKRGIQLIADPLPFNPDEDT